MKIYIDGDACSVKGLIANIVNRFRHLEVVIVVDKSHFIPVDFNNVIICDIGSDSVDKEIINRADVGDIVVTQDYDLAFVLLKKGIKVLHPHGWMFTEVSIMTKIAQRSFFRLMRDFGYKQKKMTKKQKNRRKQKGQQRLEQILGNLVQQSKRSTNENSSNS